MILILMYLPVKMKTTKNQVSTCQIILQSASILLASDFLKIFRLAVNAGDRSVSRVEYFRKWICLALTI